MTTYNYNPLWKRLIDMNMSKKQLAELTGISGSTLARMKNNKPVSMNILSTICRQLNCKVEDIVTFSQDSVNG